MIRGSLQKWSRASYYHIIDCIVKQEIKVGAEKSKKTVVDHGIKHINYPHSLKVLLIIPIVEDGFYNF